MNDSVGIIVASDKLLICTPDYGRKYPMRSARELEYILLFYALDMEFCIIKNRSGDDSHCVDIIRALLNIRCVVVEYNDHRHGYRYLRINSPEDKVLAKIKYGHLF